MDVNSIIKIEQECKRFLGTAKKAKEVIIAMPMSKYGCKETGACRRASLDLTRALAEFRKGGK